MPLREIAELLHSDAEAIRPFRALFGQPNQCHVISEAILLAMIGSERTWSWRVGRFPAGEHSFVQCEDWAFDGSADATLLVMPVAAYVAALDLVDITTVARLHRHHFTVAVNAARRFSPCFSAQLDHAR